MLALLWNVFWHRCCFPFGYPLGINVRVLGCSFLIWFVDCVLHIIFMILHARMEPQNRPRGYQGLRPPPTNHVRASPSFQGRLFIDSASFWDRFGDDFEDFSARCSVVFCNTNDKCLYTCAVAEPRLAALKIYLYAYSCTINSYLSIYSYASLFKYYTSVY